jgi:hypothetical protein
MVPFPEGCLEKFLNFSLCSVLLFNTTRTKSDFYSHCKFIFPSLPKGFTCEAFIKQEQTQTIKYLMPSLLLLPQMYQIILALKW